MPEIPQLKSENTRKQEGGYSKFKPVTPGLPAIDKTEVSDTSQHREVTFQWRMQHFPEVGAPTLRGANIWFCQIFPKLPEIERIWTPGGASLALPLDPPLHLEKLCMAIRLNYTGLDSLFRKPVPRSDLVIQICRNKRLKERRKGLCSWLYLVRKNEDNKKRRQMLHMYHWTFWVAPREFWLLDRRYSDITLIFKLKASPFELCMHLGARLTLKRLETSYGKQLSSEDLDSFSILFFLQKTNVIFSKQSFRPNIKFFSWTQYDSSVDGRPWFWSIWPRKMKNHEVATTCDDMIVTSK